MTGNVCEAFYTPWADRKRKDLSQSQRALSATSQTVAHRSNKDSVERWAKL